MAGTAKHSSLRPAVRVTRRGRLLGALFLLATTLGLYGSLAPYAPALYPRHPHAPSLAPMTSDSAFLDDLQKRALLFFIEQSDPATGMTRDRAPADGGLSTAPASVAASGFALTAWCIGDARGWLPPGEARERCRRALRFLLEKAPHERGWFYHYLDAADGRRAWKCEASTIDTALLLQGAILAREYLRDPEVTDLVARIYARIDWTWARHGGLTLTHGWWPESGFIPYRWDSYSELLGLYLLGLGAPRDPLPTESWRAWKRGPVVTYGDRTFIHCAPLFTHQYSHAWFDFRGLRDGHTDYWRNSVDATLAQRQWCADLSGRFPSWSLDLWGVTASDSARGYVAWGGPHYAPEELDGTLVPCAPGGSLPFAPAECLAALRRMREVGGEAVWRRYGFPDAFNPETGWVAPDVIAIDVGITLLMAENLRSGFIWEHFMRAPEVQRGMERAGFRRVGVDAGDWAPRLALGD